MNEHQRKMALEELGRCAGDFWYWVTRYGTIPLKVDGEQGDRRIVKFRPRPEQKRVIDTIRRDRHVYVLKARQLGISTVYALERLWFALFHPMTVHVVVAHLEESSTVIFQNLYLGVYMRLPDFMKAARPLLKQSDSMMRIDHGRGLYSEIRVSWANSANLAGQTLNSLHLSEFAKYENAEKLLSDISETVGEGQILYETTGEGYNYAQRMWVEDNGLSKLFFPWMGNPEYVRKERVTREVDVRIEEYARKYGLTTEQKWFAYERVWRRYSGDIHSFHRNMPATPELAFAVSGSRFFGKTFPEARVTYGRKTYAAPIAGRKYVMGVDTAAGTDRGDFSAWVILDVTEKWPVIVDTYYDRTKPPDFMALALNAATEFGAVANIEKNSYGLSVLDFFIQQSYGRLYRQNVFDKSTGQYSSSFGFVTGAQTRPLLLNELTQHVDSPEFAIVDQRIQAEVNAFTSIDGKPQAGPGAHDDILIALALALIARGQTVSMEQDVYGKRPHTHEEMLRFYVMKGRKVLETDVFDDDEPSGYGTLQSVNDVGGFI